MITTIPHWRFIPGITVSQFDHKSPLCNSAIGVFEREAEYNVSTSALRKLFLEQANYNLLLRHLPDNR